MVGTKLTCEACGQHFETKSDLQDHQKNCIGQRSTGKQQKNQGGSSGWQDLHRGESALKTRGAGSGGTWSEDQG